MREIEFAPLNKRIPFVGLGCGRLLGRDGLRQSAKIVETALDAGIRYFDVAPSYGVGTAEEVLGQVIGSNPDVVIATKVGIPRPHYNVLKNKMKLLFKPFINRSVRIKQLILRMIQRPAPAAPSLHDFSMQNVSRTLTESLERLGRNTVDVLLAHEPTPEALTLEMETGFRREVEKGRALSYGIGIGAESEPWQKFGTIWQSRWTNQIVVHNEHEVARVFHGVVKSALEVQGKPSYNFRSSMQQIFDNFPNALVLVSASVPTRLRELIAVANEIG